jgi:hypothetical protein
VDPLTKLSLTLDQLEQLNRLIHNYEAASGMCVSVCCCCCCCFFE